jgi:hypothetical protein
MVETERRTARRPDSDRRSNATDGAATYSNSAGRRSSAQTRSGGESSSVETVASVRSRDANEVLLSHLGERSP